jgi:serine/threonine-protein kinase
MPANDPHPVKKGASLFTDGDIDFRLVRVLGDRDNGELVLARRRLRDGGPSGLVVVKRLHRPEAPHERQRLLEEAKLAMRLDHPSIARVLHVATHLGAPHVVVEYIRGLSLELAQTFACVREKPVSAAFAAYVAAEVADALHHAHTLTDEHGRALHLVHREVSPRNIRLGKAGEVKLIDFGVAHSRLKGRRPTSKPCLKGEAIYASPEALRLGKLDARSDLFSLGLVLLEMLTNRHLYDPPDERPATFLQKVMASYRANMQQGMMYPEQLALRAAALRPHDVQREARNVPEALRTVLDRALRVAPSERYATAAEMRDALRAALAQLAPHYGRRELLEELRTLIADTEEDRREFDLEEEGAMLPRALSRRIQKR